MKKRRILLSLTLVAVMLITFGQTIFAATSDKGVYVIPIRGNIGPSVESFISNQLKEAEKLNIDSVIFDINTLGGNVNSTLNIQEIVKDYSKKFKFYSFINNKAESAGVMISLLGDKIFMTNEATVGSASVIPYDEKTNSAWSSMLKAQAEAKGKPGDIAKATADYNMVIKDVKEKGTLLNMTAKEAIDLKFADSTAEDIDEVVKKLEYRGGKVVVAEKDFKVMLSDLISNPYISSLLLLVGIVLLVLELFIPSFGILGTLGSLSIGTYFLGNIFAGHTSWWALGILILGIILAIIEIHVPGFGIAGITGIILVSVSIVMAAETVQMGLVIMILAWIIVGICIYLLIKYGLNKGPFSKMILKSNTGSKEYLSYDPSSLEGLVGKEGVANSLLRPSGTGVFDGEVLDIQSNSEFIKKGEAIKIIKVEGNKIVVKKI